MPTTKKFGSPSAANQKIGGVPTLHYFDFQSRGRGQVVRLMWEVSSLRFLPPPHPQPSPPSIPTNPPPQDAGIAYEDVRYTFAEYPDYKKSKIAALNPTATIPVIELNGQILTQSYAILRHFARLLGKYDGTTEDEKYWADAMCDIAIDCA